MTNFKSWFNSGSGSTEFAATFISRPNFAYIRLVFLSFSAFLSLILFHFRPIIEHSLSIYFLFLLYINEQLNNMGTKVLYNKNSFYYSSCEKFGNGNSL